MNLPDGLLGSTATWLAWLFFVPLVWHAVRQAPWRVLNDSARLNVWLGMIVVLILLWNLQAGVKPGLALHLLGAMVFTLCFDWALAFVGLCVVLAGVSLNGAAGWEAFALNALLMGGVGVAASQGIQRLVSAVLPAQLFVYIFANGGSLVRRSRCSPLARCLACSSPSMGRIVPTTSPANICRILCCSGFPKHGCREWR